MLTAIFGPAQSSNSRTTCPLRKTLIFLFPLSHENTGCFVFILFRTQISIAFLASHFCKEAYMKQKLNASTFLHIQWRKVGYANWPSIPATWLSICAAVGYMFIFCFSCCHPKIERHTPCIASVGHRKKITLTLMKFFQKDVGTVVADTTSILSKWEQFYSILLHFKGLALKEVKCTLQSQFPRA